MFKPDEIDVNIVELSPIIHIKGALDEDTRKGLIDNILKVKEDKGPSPDTAPKCWRDAFRVGTEDGYDSKYGDTILKLIQQGLETFQNTFAVPTNFYTDSKARFFNTESLSVDAWVNVNDKGGANSYHSHTGGIMSGIVYLQSFGTGEIVLKSDRVVFEHYHPLWPYYGSARYKPDDGDLLLFPSYLGHWVESNPIDKQRINVAFDVRFPEKQN